MNHRGHYCPPDFNDPPPDSCRQYEPRPSGFQPDLPSSHPHPHQYEEEAAGSAWGSYGPEEYCDTQEYYGDGGQQWHQGGGYKRRKRRRFFFKRKKRYAFRCESCDKGFVEVESYDEHMSQHVECPHPNCTYVGSDKFVTMHWKFAHTAESKRFNFKTSEDIDKWRQERRKKYPRRENTDEKNAEAKEETGNKETAPSTEPCDANETPQRSSEKSEKST